MGVGMVIGDGAGVGQAAVAFRAVPLVKPSLSFDRSVTK